jgi:hypothetical protein
VEHCVKAAGELIGKVMSAKENAGTAGLNPDGAPNANPPPGQSPVTDFLATRNGLALTKAFMEIKDAKLRRNIVNLVEELAG